MRVPHIPELGDEQPPASTDTVGREASSGRGGGDPDRGLLGEPRRPAEPDSVAQTLLTILGLLDAAATAERARPAGGDPLFALGLDLAAGRTANLLPTSYTGGPADQQMDDAAATAVRQLALGSDPLLLLRAAEELTRAHETEDYPPGTTELVVRLIELLRDWTP